MKLRLAFKPDIGTFCDEETASSDPLSAIKMSTTTLAVADIIQDVSRVHLLNGFPKIVGDSGHKFGHLSILVSAIPFHLLSTQQKCRFQIPQSVRLNKLGEVLEAYHI
jgi:hypothetical protein